MQRRQDDAQHHGLIAMLPANAAKHPDDAPRDVRAPLVVALFSQDRAERPANAESIRIRRMFDGVEKLTGCRGVRLLATVLLHCCDYPRRRVDDREPRRGSVVDLGNCAQECPEELVEMLECPVRLALSKPFHQLSCVVRGVMSPVSARSLQCDLDEQIE